MIKLDLGHFSSDPKQTLSKIWQEYTAKVHAVHMALTQKNCPSHEMLEWLDYPTNYDQKEMQVLLKLSREWHANNKVKNIVMIGIGGSYIGVRAGIDYVLFPFNRDKEIYYVTSLSASYYYSLIEKLKKEDFYLVICSKSGNTLEIMTAFTLFYQLLYEKHGSEGANERIVCITSKTHGYIRALVDQLNLKAFAVPEGIGGRFSALTPVGLFVMGALGLNVLNLLKGAKKALQDSSVLPLTQNTAYQYAVLRHYLYHQKKKTVEVFCYYEDDLRYFGEHLKQLFAESEGKNQQGILPYTCLFTTDLHSVGQFLQEGNQIFFETTLQIKKPLADLTLNVENFLPADHDFAFLHKKTVDGINKIAASSTSEAHHLDANIPIIKLEINQRNEESFGYLYTWFSKVVAVSGLLFNINPFDQPGVETYKKRMFAKLRK